MARVISSPARWRGRRGRLLLTLVAAAAACSDGGGTAPQVPPYLALVSLFDAPPHRDEAAGFGYRVEDVGNVDPTVDTVVGAVPGDTVILALPSSSYRVTLLGLPPRCLPRSGTEQIVGITEELNTGIARYIISCEPSLRFAAFSFGPQPDDGFVWLLEPAGGEPRSGVLPANDTAFVTPLAPGDYRLTLGHVAPNCTVVSDGGATQRFSVVTTAGPFRAFSVSCSDPAQRPEIVSIRGSHHDGAVALVIRATDPDRDLNRFYFDVTDCEGTSVLPAAAFQRSPIDRARLTADTAVFLAALELIEVGLDDAALEGRCVGGRVVDERGNTSPIVERRLQERGRRTEASLFNAVLSGQTLIRLHLEVGDPDDDYVGIVVAERVRDGVRREADGKDDFASYNPEGYLAPEVPDLQLGGFRPSASDVNGVVVYLIDAAGNFSRYLDDDTFN